MRLSEVGNKEIIDITTGRKYGELWDAEMIFDMETGRIKALLVPDAPVKSKFRSNLPQTQLPWSCIVKIGEDIIIFRSQ